VDLAAAEADAIAMPVPPAAAALPARAGGTRAGPYGADEALGAEEGLPVEPGRPEAALVLAASAFLPVDPPSAAPLSAAASPGAAPAAATENADAAASAHAPVAAVPRDATPVPAPPSAPSATPAALAAAAAPETVPAAGPAASAGMDAADPQAAGRAANLSADVAAPAPGPPAAVAPAGIVPVAPSPAAALAELAPPPLRMGLSRADPPGQVAATVAVLVQRGEGAHRLTLRLDPVELGRIEIVVNRHREGPAEVMLTVERPETLLRLVRDQEQLARALDQAGLRAEGRTVSFQLAAPPPPADVARAPAAPPADPGSGFTLNQQHGGMAGGGGGHSGARHDGQPGPPSWAGWSRDVAPEVGGASVPMAALAVAVRNGIDITA